MIKHITAILPLLLSSSSTYANDYGAPALPPNVRSLQGGIGTIDFENFDAGDVVGYLGFGVSVKAKKIVKGQLKKGQAMIFDTANPTGGDFE
jgi:hypothetical protein